MVFIAKFPGRCDDCRDSITPGQAVMFKGLDRRLVHEVCDDAGPDLTDLDRDAQKPVCGRHWMVQPCGECEVE